MKIIPGLRGTLVDILAGRSPLTVREIGDEFLVREMQAVTRQAIHLTLTQLQKDNYVEKEGSRYRLSSRLEVELEELLTRMKADTSPLAIKNNLLERGESRSYEVQSLLELDSRWNSLVSEILQLYPTEAPPYLQQVPHAWFALCKFEDEVRISKLLVGRCQSFYTCVMGNTPLDRWLKGFYSKLNSHYWNATDSRPRAMDIQRATIGDFVLEATYPRRHAEELASLFSSCQQLADLDLNKFLRFISSREKITIRLSRDKAEARKLRTSILNHFRE